ncbi:MAG TPA: thioredoxin family protein [Opitutales bacterium]|nr:thioredoxin family protein [Opitutales bacterium]
MRLPLAAHPRRLATAAISLGLLALAACSKSTPTADNAAAPAAAKHAARLGTWTDDYAAAVKQAKAENKNLLLDFTGSDWCVNCWNLDDGVFSKPAFADYAQAHLVLVTLDFPIKTKLSDALTQQNAALMQKYHVEGLPTIVLLSPDEKQLAFLLGYGGQSVEQFIAQLEHPAPPH